MAATEQTARVDAGDDLVFRKVVELLAPYNPDGIAISRDTELTNDLEIDSVAVMDLIMEIEDDYQISFPLNLISEIRTVGELVDAIHKMGERQ